MSALEAIDALVEAGMTDQPLEDAPAAGAARVPTPEENNAALAVLQSMMAGIG